MSEILFHYQKIDPTTWVYVSSLLMFGLFFQFNRFWSVRNLDLVLLILLAPGLLMVNEARDLTKPLRHGHRDIALATTTTTSPAEPAPSESESAIDQPVSSIPAGNAPPATPDESDTGDRLARHRMAYTGYLWLFGVSSIWLI